MDHENVDILIIEDDPNDARLILRVFKKYNLTNDLIHLSDGAEALAYLFGEGAQGKAGANNPSKVILLDLKLPKVDGIEVLRRIRTDERTKEIPVVILTSSSEERDIKAAYDLGVNSYVTKPIRFDEFSSVVAKLGLYWMLINKPPAD